MELNKIKNSDLWLVCVQTHQILHIKYVQIFVYQFTLMKLLKKNQTFSCYTFQVLSGLVAILLYRTGLEEPSTFNTE